MNESVFMSPLRVKPYGLYTCQVGHLGLHGWFPGGSHGGGRRCIGVYVKSSAEAVVAPQLRAIGLPCIASPEIMSSGNTQHIGTENNRFIDASGTEFILQQWSRPSGTLGAAEQYVHYLVNIKGPRLEQLRGSGIKS